MTFLSWKAATCACLSTYADINIVDMTLAGPLHSTPRCRPTATTTTSNGVAPSEEQTPPVTPIEAEPGNISDTNLNIERDFDKAINKIQSSTYVSNHISA